MEQAKAQQYEQLAVSLEGAVAVTACSRSRIFKAMAASDLKGFKIGRRRMFLMTELKAWLEREARAGAR